ncbi:MAG: ABC transporter permease [Anaerolineales bacterium]|nr:ABC transporter permease [Anaerolineales bacterium]
MLFESLRLALRALSANKLRAALTMLGITIGVAAVITLLSVGQGVSRYISAQFEGLGSNLVFVFPGQFSGNGPPGRGVVDAYLTLEDAQALMDPARVPDAGAVVPILGRNAALRYADRTAESTLRATTPDYLTARNYSLLSGRFITASDLEERARVVVLGQTVLNRLFAADEDPLGATIRLNGYPFRVVGILAPKGATPFGDEDDVLMLPYTTAAARLFSVRTLRGESRVSLILVKAADPASQSALITQITDVLRERHSIPYRGDDDFTVLSEEDLLKAFAQVTNVLTLFLGAIAGIALLVGGIGIMNIMLVTVSERTKEIGLRKAVGARRAHVLMQFLVEAVVLAVLGGALGIGLGWLGAWGLQQAVPDLDTSVTLRSILLATGFSIAVGLFFGLYPAVRASGLSPIEALRYE